MPKCIVSTREDGVSITYPTREIMSMLTCGGAPPGYFGKMSIDGQIASMVSRGIPEWVAFKYLKHLFCGGLTDAEAHELIRDRDTAPDWTAKELWDCSDVPQDRTYRDAWRRSHNGGPIEIDLSKARTIQLRRVKAGRDAAQLFEIRRRIWSTRDVQELRHIV